MAAGAASLSDSSIRSVPSSTSSSSSTEREVGVVDVLGAVRAKGLGRPILADDEVPEDLLGDEEGALDLGDGRRGRLEDDDVVRAFTVALDRIGQPPAAPRGDLDDLAAVGGDLAGGAIDDRGDSLVRGVRTEHEHEFVAAHGPSAPSCGNAPLS